MASLKIAFSFIQWLMNGPVGQLFHCNEDLISLSQETGLLVDHFRNCRWIWSTISVFLWKAGHNGTITIRVIYDHLNWITIKCQVESLREAVSGRHASRHQWDVEGGDQRKYGNVTIGRPLCNRRHDSSVATVPLPSSISVNVKSWILIERQWSWRATLSAFLGVLSPIPAI